MGFWKKEDEENTASGASSPESKQTSGETEIGSSKEPSVFSGMKKEEKQSAEPRTESKASKNLTPEDSIMDRFGKVRSALGQGTVIQGKLSFDTPVRIDGKLSGEIFSSKALIIGESGEIDAKVEVACLIVMGRVTGSIKATEKIELWAGGTIEGDIETPNFMMEETARFDGQCKMTAAPAAVEVEKETEAQAAKESSGAKQTSPDKSGSSKSGDSKEVRLH